MKNEKAGLFKLSRPEIKTALSQLEGWRRKEKGIVREVEAENFMQAVNLIRRITRLAETANHHPDLHLTGHRYLKIVLTTHAVKGLSALDFQLAKQINKLLTPA